MLIRKYFESTDLGGGNKDKIVLVLFNDVIYVMMMLNSKY